MWMNKAPTGVIAKQRQTSRNDGGDALTQAKTQTASNKAAFHKRRPTEAVTIVCFNLGFAMLVSGLAMVLVGYTRGDTVRTATHLLRYFGIVLAVIGLVVMLCSGTYFMLYQARKEKDRGGNSGLPVQAPAGRPHDAIPPETQAPKEDEEEPPKPPDPLKDTWATPVDRESEREKTVHKNQVTGLFRASSYQV